MIWRVRTTRVEIVICVLLLTMTIFNHRTTLAYGERIECTLYEAIRNDYVIALIEGAYSGYEESFDLTNGYGVFYGPCISVWVSSLVDETLVITVKLGRYLIPDDYDVQNMMITKEYTFTLEAYENTTLTLYAMCIEMHDYVPSEGEFFDLGSLATGYLYDLVCEIEDNYAQDAAGQAAIWAITDHATEEDLREMGADTYVLKRAQALLDDADVPYSVVKEEEYGYEEETRTSNNTLLAAALAVILIIIVVGVVVAVSRHYEKKRSPPQQPPYYP